MRSVNLVIQDRLKNEYGQTRIGNIGTCSLSAKQASKFVWDELTDSTAWRVYDSTWLLPPSPLACCVPS
jgi:hypothetical protein